MTELMLVKQSSQPSKKKHLLLEVVDVCKEIKRLTPAKKKKKLVSDVQRRNRAFFISCGIKYAINKIDAAPIRHIEKHTSLLVLST
mmetsp:Transcript_14716/g.21510  ORF Transcript_14716/g.21510 Transcript_14716/m.21510 type:complete len:86 (-) Transcript_14716:88-345(-)